LDGFARHRRPRNVAAGGIADHAGHVADQEDDSVSEVLEVAHLAQQDGMAEVQIGRGRVEAGLDAQRPAGFRRLHQALAQIGFANDLRHSFAEVCELFVDRHSFKSSAVFRSAENRWISSTCSMVANISRPPCAIRMVSPSRTTGYAKPLSVIMPALPKVLPRSPRGQRANAAMLPRVNSAAPFGLTVHWICRLSRRAADSGVTFCSGRDPRRSGLRASAAVPRCSPCQK